MSVRDELNKIEQFYMSLSESQKQKVESKIKGMLRETYETLPQENIDPIRWQVATDMFKILND